MASEKAIGHKHYKRGDELGPCACNIFPPKGRKKHHNLCTLAADGPKPKTNHILGYEAQNTISSAPNAPATTHFWWFPTLKIALTDA